MLCPCWELLNPGAAPAVLPQPRRKHPSAQRFVQRPICRLYANEKSERHLYPYFVPVLSVLYLSWQRAGGPDRQSWNFVGPVAKILELRRF